MDDLHALLAEARSRLVGLPQDALGMTLEPRRWKAMLGARSKIVRAGTAWRVGCLLIADGVPDVVGGVQLAEVGEILRAAQETRRGYAADTQRSRAERQAMAFRGGFAEGEALHLNWKPIDVTAVSARRDYGPLHWSNGSLMIRWSRTGDSRRVEEYLDDQLALLP